MQQNESLLTPAQTRICRLQKIIADQKHQMLQKIKRTQEDLLTSRKHKQHKKTLEERVFMVDKFIKEITTTFYTMLSDKQFLSFTTEIDLVEKIDKFKKYTHNSMQKMTANLSNRNSPFKTNLSKISYETDAQERELRKKATKTKPIWKKSKNSKMSSETSMVMTDWLLRNFQNPYPTTQEKLLMAKESNISVTQVNNWFINARERTIKGYFNKEL